MRYITLTLLIMNLTQYCEGQSIVSGSESKSGILVGSETSFSGIGYESATDKFTLNYKSTRQDDHNNGHFPNFIGLNIGANVAVEKSKASIVSDGKWQGGLGIDLTILRTIDKTKIPSEVNEVLIAHQHTFFLTLSDVIDRFKSYEINGIAGDTTFASLHNPFMNNFTIALGYNAIHQINDQTYFSFAVSCNVSLIQNSSRGLTKSFISPNSSTLLNSSDSSMIIQGDKTQEYSLGKADNEVYTVPRLDIFIRHSIGPKKPVVGFLLAYSPLVSSLSSVPLRHAISIGPTFGLDTFVDQVVFSFQNEFIQNNAGDFKYRLTFQTSIPFVFN